MANRYQQLLARTPKGSFYDAVGNIIPSRGDDPYEFLFTPVPALRTYGVFVNEQFRGEVTSDGAGTAVVRVLLDQGRQDIVLVDKETQERFPAWVEVRVSATVQAAHADVIEGIDAQVDEVQKSLALETATSRYIEDVYGRPVRQANDFGTWLLDSYRRVVRRLRQAFRIWGSKLLGLRQTVHAFTSALPLRVNRLWRPRWLLGTDLMPNSDFQGHTRLTASPLTNLNIESVDFVHATFGGVPTIFPGPFTNPPSAQPLQVTFSALWDGGAVTISGLDPLGNAVGDTIAPTGGPLPETVVGVANFASVSSATKGPGVNGTASIGVATGRFIKVVSFGDLNTPTAHLLEYIGAPDRLRWGGATAPTVDISSSSPFLVDGKGRFTLREPDMQALWFSLLIEPGGGYVVGDEHFLALSADEKGIVHVDLAEVAYGGGASPRTAAQIATSVNTYLARDTRYGAVRASASIACSTGGAIGAFADNTVTIDLDDGPHGPVTLSFYQTVAPVLPVVGILYLPGDTADQIADRIRNVIDDVVEGTGGALRMTASTPTPATGFVNLRQDIGGAVGNTAIVFSANALFAGFTGGPFLGGVDGSYSTFATAVSGLNGLGPVIRFLRVSAGPVGPASTFKVHPVGADGARVALGEPRFADNLSLDAVARAVLLDLPAPNRLPTVRDAVVVHDAITDSAVAIITTGFAAMHPGAVEMFFDAGWRGGAVTVTGTARDGSTVSEIFTPPANEVASGVGASSADGITVTVPPGVADYSLIGKFFRLTSGALVEAGAYIRGIVSTTSIRLTGTGVGAAFGASDWKITDGATVEGTTAFAAVAQMSRTLYPSGVSPGTATLLLAGAALRGYAARVGRNVRMTQFIPGVSSVSLVAGTNGQMALFSTGVSARRFDQGDIGGYILIQGSTIDGGTNNGLHPIINVPLSGALIVATIRHGEADRGGRFFAETFGGLVTWRVYSPGELVTVIGKDLATGNLTLLPPGIVYPRATGDLVELADEMPFTQLGQEGPGTVTVDVDRDFIPTPPQSDSLVLSGTVVPDGWRALNQAGPSLDRPGYMVPQRLTLRGDSVDSDGIGAKQAIQAALPLGLVVAYRGLVLRASFWVQQHVTSLTENLRIDFSFDGVVFVPGAVVPGSSSANPEPVPGTMLFATGGSGSLDPHLVEAQAEVPYNASVCIVRLVHEGVPVIPPPFALVSLEKMMVVATHATGLSLGDNTIPRSAHREKFGEVLYVWSPEPLESSEKTALGVPLSALASFPLVEGQIDRIVNAHGYWERFDISEYSGSPAVAVNVKGTYDDLGWSAATLTNMEVVVGTPPRATVVRPSFISLVEREALAIVAPSNASLAEVSAHEGPFPEESFVEERLFESGLPVPATPSVTGGVLPWRFLAPAPSQLLQIASVAAGDPGSQSVFNPAALYTLSYRRMIRAEPSPFDLGAGFGDYLWLVDAAIYRRTEPGSTPFVRTQQLTILASLRATLDVRSDQDQVASSLVRDTGFARTLVPQSSWRYVDAATVEIDATVFDANSIYALTYNALEPKYVRPAQVVIEARSGVDFASCMAATYRVVVVDEPVNRAHQWHQLRVTISGVVAGRVQMGSGATTANVSGTSVVLASGSFVPGVKPGRVFRILSGNATGKAANILSATGTQLKLDADLGVESAVDWEITTTLFGTDIEVAGLGLRGINLYGSPPYAPGIITP